MADAEDEARAADGIDEAVAPDVFAHDPHGDERVDPDATSSPWGLDRITARGTDADARSGPGQVTRS